MVIEVLTCTFELSCPFFSRLSGLCFLLALSVQALIKARHLHQRNMNGPGQRMVLGTLHSALGPSKPCRKWLKWCITHP